VFCIIGEEILVEPLELVGLGRNTVAGEAALEQAPRAAPIIERASANGTGGRPSRARMTLSVSTRSGAVSISVPSRSKTMSMVGDR